MISNELAMDQFEQVQAGLTTVEPERAYFPGLLNLNMGWCAYQMEDHARADSLYSPSTEKDRAFTCWASRSCGKRKAEWMMPWRTEDLRQNEPRARFEKR